MVLGLPLPLFSIASFSINSERGEVSISLLAAFTSPSCITAMGLSLKIADRFVPPDLEIIFLRS